MNKMKSENRIAGKNIFFVIIVTYAIVPISGFGTDIYLPSMPPMASEFHTSQNAIQITLSIFLISLYDQHRIFVLHQLSSNPDL